MDVLVVRHGVAEEREVFARTGEADAERPLTAAGRKKLERAVRGLRRLVPAVDVVATSPLVRAAQTAEILGDGYGRLQTVSLEELAPDARPDALLAWLRAERRKAVVAIVGHEPHLSALVELLLTGKSSGFVALKKGGACLLSFPRTVAAGGAELRWLLTGGQLRRLAR